jgi:fumarate hydratase class II
VRIPLIARNLLQSIHLLTSDVDALREKVVDGPRAQPRGLRALAESTLAVATALNPFIGYDKASEIVKEASSRAHAARGRARARRRRGDARQALDLRKIAAGSKA